MIKNPLAVPETQETRVRSLDQEDLLGKEMATRSSIPAWKIPWTEQASRLTDLAVVPREKPHTGAAAREQPRDSPVIER